MQTKKAKYFIEKSQELHEIWQTNHLNFSENDMITAVELAEDEMRGKAIECFCVFQCPQEIEHFECRKDKCCVSLKDFINLLNNEL